MLCSGPGPIILVDEPVPRKPATSPFEKTAGMDGPYVVALQTSADAPFINDAKNDRGCIFVDEVDRGSAVSSLFDHRVPPLGTHRSFYGPVVFNFLHHLERSLDLRRRELKTSIRGQPDGEAGLKHRTDRRNDDNSVIVCNPVATLSADAVPQLMVDRDAFAVPSDAALRVAASGVLEAVRSVAVAFASHSSWNNGTDRFQVQCRAFKLSYMSNPNETVHLVDYQGPAINPEQVFMHGARAADGKSRSFLVNEAGAIVHTVPELTSAVTRLADLVERLLVVLEKK